MRRQDKEREGFDLLIIVIVIFILLGVLGSDLGLNLIP